MTALGAATLLSIPLAASLCAGAAVVGVSLACAPAARAADPLPLFANGHDGVCVACHGTRTDRLYIFQPRRSSLKFRINASFAGVIEGRYRRIQGGFFMDPDKPEQSAVAATMRTGSVATGDLLFDLMLNSEAFLDADRHPYVVFFSKKVLRTGERTGRIVGDLTLRGVTRPIEMDVTFKEDLPSTSRLPDTIAFVAKGSVKRRDFGITFVPSGTDEIVTVTIEAEGKRASKPR